MTCLLSPDPGDCTNTIDKRSEVAVKQLFIHKTQNHKMKAQKNHSTAKTENAHYRTEDAI